MDELISDEPPPPLIMEPDAAPTPAKKEKAEKKEKVEKPKKVEAKRQASAERPQPMAEARPRTLGATGDPEAPAKGRDRRASPAVSDCQEAAATFRAPAQATCLAQIAASIRGHTPAVTSLGPGTVNVTFYVNSGGGISSISASGGSPAHAALARRIVASSRGPSSCGAVYARQGITFQ